MVYLNYLAAGCIAWYTVNVARVTWRTGNKSGAIAVGVLAALVMSLPALTALIRG